MLGGQAPRPGMQDDKVPAAWPPQLTPALSQLATQVNWLEELWPTEGFSPCPDIMGKSRPLELVITITADFLEELVMALRAKAAEQGGPVLPVVHNVHLSMDLCNAMVKRPIQLMMSLHSDAKRWQIIPITPLEYTQHDPEQIETI